MAKKFRYSHLFTTKSGSTAISAAEEKLREAEIGLAVADGEEKILFKNENEEVVAVPTEEQVDAKLANKTDYEVNGSNGRALIFNETDGGGAKFEHNDGTWSFAGVNNGGANGLAAQVYAVDSQNDYKGTKLDVTVGGLYYTKGEESGKPASQRDVEANEVATKGDIQDASSAITDAIEDLTDAVETLQDTKFGAVEYDADTKHINFYAESTGGTVLGYVDAEDFVVDGMIKEVKIDDVVISGQTVRCLVIIWNTDAGDKETDIPLTDIFDPENYYNKTQIDNIVDGIEDEIDEVASAITDIQDDITEINTAITEIQDDITEINGAIVDIESAITDIQDEMLIDDDIATLTVAEKSLVNGGNVEISVTELSTSGATDFGTDEEGNILLEAGEF